MVTTYVFSNRFLVIPYAIKLVGIDLLVITRAAQWNNQSKRCYIIITHAQETQLTKVDVSSPEPKIQKCLGKALERSVDTVESHRDDGGGATLSIWILKLKTRFYLWIWPSTHAGSSNNQSSGCYIIITRPRRKRQSILTKPPQTTYGCGECLPFNDCLCICLPVQVAPIAQ